MAQLNADVPEELRTRARLFCLRRKILVQDFVRALVQRALDEAEGGRASKFVRDVLDRVTPAEEPTPATKNVVPLRPRKRR